MTIVVRIFVYRLGEDKVWREIFGNNLGIKTHTFTKGQEPFSDIRDENQWKFWLSEQFKCIRHQMYKHGIEDVKVDDEIRFSVVLQRLPHQNPPLEYLFPRKQNGEIKILDNGKVDGV
jgi:hypothetical protein